MTTGVIELAYFIFNVVFLICNSLYFNINPIGPQSVEPAALWAQIHNYFDPLSDSSLPAATPEILHPLFQRVWHPERMLTSEPIATVSISPLPEEAGENQAGTVTRFSFVLMRRQWRNTGDWIAEKVISYHTRLRRPQPARPTAYQCYNA